MGAATVVDQLIVKLGLDPKDFSKGQKAAAAAVKETEKDVKKSSEGMSRSIVAFTGKLLGIATAAVAIKKAVGYVSDLSTTVRRLGIDSRNFGIAAAELRNFQNIAEMEGGKADEATASIANLTKAVFDLAYNGQVSDSLVMLGRLGVRFQTTAGDARDFRDIVLDTQTAIQRAMQGGMSRQNANQFLRQAGFDPGLTQAILNGTVGTQLSQQESRRQVSTDIVDAATKWEKSATNRDQAIAAATLRTLPAAAAAGTASNDMLAKGAEFLSDATLSGTLEDIGNALSVAGEKVKEGANKFIDSLEAAAARAREQMWVKGRENYESTIQAAAKRHGIDPEMLAGVLATESNFDPAAVSSAGARGIAQLMPKYFPNAGKNPHEDIDEAAAYLRALRDSFQQSGMNEDDAYWHAFQSYNAGQSRVRKSMQPGGKPLKQETLNYPRKVLEYAAGGNAPAAQGGSNSTEVNIGNVTINTKATDAEGIAQDFAGATKRKVMAAQADTGMT